MTARGLIVALVLLLATACGVQPTGVLYAGPAPSMPDPRTGVTPSELILYFVADGRLESVARPWPSAKVAITAALTVLMKGPDYTEASRGVTTYLPPGAGPVSVSVAGGLTVTVPFSVKNLPGLAINQLACTALTALTMSGQASVPTQSGMDLIGQDGSAGFWQCTGT